MFGIDKENRGEKTIDICNLNSTELKKSRQEVVDRLLYDLKTILASYDEKILDIQGVISSINKVFCKINDEQNIKYSFSLMRKYIFDNFETLIVTLFTHVKQREILIQAYQLYRKGQL